MGHSDLQPAKSRIKKPRDHDFYWFIGPDRPFIAELIEGGDYWHLPGEVKAWTTEELANQELYRWRRVQFPVDLRTAYDLPRGYGKQDREKMKKVKDKQKLKKREAKKKFYRKEVKDIIATRGRKARGKN